ncbi:MAG: UDP-N-acetylglucosamine 2-epimerase (non-hydrolyzing) [Candidatus Micrarchaeota archaeon]|nr:UDP-N-acetylglucosamine 2-epimerase (non-hydrolyzing) [Candidatus Micrarchaeota archaeon]
MKMAHAFGTRACAIKMAPLIRESKRRGHETLVLWSGQHYSPNLYSDLFGDLELPRPDYDMGAKGTTIEMGSEIMRKTEEICRKEKPDIVLVHGDTFSAMFFALGAALSLVPVGHVEAGLRTDSWEPFPEQICTRAADACSSLYFAPTKANALGLAAEGYPKERIFAVGNTVVDAIREHSELARAKSRILEKLNLRKPLIFWSCHRKENFIHPDRMRGIFESLLELKSCDIFCSVLPSTQQIAEEMGFARRLERAPHIRWLPSLPKYTDSLRILMESDLCLTDSGGLEEECISLRVPCLTLRYVTDRPETVEAGANKCIGFRKSDIVREVKRVMENKRLAERMRRAKNPYGDGKASSRIMRIIEKFRGKMDRWETKTRKIS